MRKFSFEVLNEQEFRAFAEASPQSNFQQTVEMANLRRMHGMDVDFVGMREDGEIKAGPCSPRIMRRWRRSAA